MPESVTRTCIIFRNCPVCRRSMHNKRDVFISNPWIFLIPTGGYLQYRAAAVCTETIRSSEYSRVLRLLSWRNPTGNHLVGYDLYDLEFIDRGTSLQFRVSHRWALSAGIWAKRRCHLMCSARKLSSRCSLVKTVCRAYVMVASRNNKSLLTVDMYDLLTPSCAAHRSSKLRCLVQFAHLLVPVFCEAGLSSINRTRSSVQMLWLNVTVFPKPHPVSIARVLTFTGLFPHGRV